MQLREMVDMQSLLSVAISARKPQTSDVQNRTFDKILDLKKVETASPTKSEKETPIQAKDESLLKTQEPKNNSVKQESKATSQGKTTENKPSETEVDKKTDKIKAVLKLSDEQLESLLGMLGMNLEAFQKVFDITVDFDNLDLLQGLHENLVLLEVGNDLGSQMDLGLVENLKSVVSEMLTMLEASNENGNAFQTDLALKLEGLIKQLDDLTMDPKATYESFVAAIKLPQSHQDLQPVESKVKQEISSEEIEFFSDKTPKMTIENDQPRESAKEKASDNSLSTHGKAAEQVPTESKNSELPMSFHQMIMKQDIPLPVEALQVLKQDAFGQIMEAMKGIVKIDDNGTSMLVKLQPEQLGNVELKLNIHKGVVLAEIKVENEIVKAAVESNLDDLRQNLGNKGFTVNSINVSIDLGTHDQASQEQGQSRLYKSKNTKVVSETELLEDVLNAYQEVYKDNAINYLG